MRWSFIIVLSLLLNFACKKDQDDQIPQVFISAPSDNSSFSISDPIQITARINDNEVIKRVSIALYNSQTRVLADKVVSIYPNVKDYSLDYVFRFTDSLLPSGQYYFKVSAFDEFQEGVDFRTINLNGIPKTYVETIIANSDLGTTHIQGRNANGQIRTIFSYNGSCQKIQIDNNNQVLWIVDTQNRVIAYDLKQERIMHDQLLPNNGINAFITDLIVANEKAFISTRNGEIRAYSTSFSDVYTYRSQSGWYPINLAIVNNYLLAEELELGRNNYQLNSIFLSTGSRNASTSLQDKFLGIRALKGNPSQIMLANDSAILLQAYFPETGIKNNLTAKNLDKAVNAFPYLQNDWVIQTDSSLFYYNQTSGLTNRIVFQSGNSAMAYNEIAKELILGYHQQVDFYNAETGAFRNSVALQGQVKSIAVRYNY